MFSGISVEKGYFQIPCIKCLSVRNGRWKKKVGKFPVGIRNGISFLNKSFINVTQVFEHCMGTR